MTLLNFFPLVFVKCLYFLCLRKNPSGNLFLCMFNLGFNIFPQMDSQSMLFIESSILYCSLKAPLSRKPFRSREKRFCYQG